MQSIISNKAESDKEEYVDHKPELIAAGRPFGASILQPKETLKRSFLIHFPQNKYDMLEVTLLLPTVAVPDKVKTKWDVGTNNVVGVKFFRIGSDKEIQRDDDGRYDEKIGLQLKLTRAELSLWH